MPENITNAFMELERIMPCSGKLAEDPSRSEHHRRLLHDERERIKQLLLRESMSLDNDERTVRYIRYHQFMLVSMIDSAGSCLGATGQGIPCAYCDCLHDLLRFLYERFSSFFDLDQPAPALLVARQRDDAARIATMFDKELARMGVEHELQELIKYPVRKLAQHENKAPVTFRQLHFIALLDSEVRKIVASSAFTEGVNHAIADILLHLNYNSLRCFDYFKNLTAQKLTAERSLGETVNCFLLLLKRVNQTTVRENSFYRINQPSLKSQVEHYILEELAYAERVSRVPMSAESKPQASFDPAAKIKMGISVSDIAYLLRILKETDVIQNTNVTEMLRFFSRIVQAKKAGEVSYDSLRAKYYNVEHATIQRVKSLMLAAVERMGKASLMVSWFLMKGVASVVHGMGSRSWYQRM